MITGMTMMTLMTRMTEMTRLTVVAKIAKMTGMTRVTGMTGMTRTTRRGAEWYLEKCGSRKILAGSRNLGSVCDKSRSLVFSWFVFIFLSLENFHQRVSGSDF